MITLKERKEKLYSLTDVFFAKFSSSPQEAKIVFHSIIDLVIEDAEALRESKAEKSDIKELIAVIKTRFEAMDKRFEDLQNYMDKRFEALQNSMDKRFEALQNSMDKRFEAVDKRFEAVDKRFEDLQNYMDKRFESMDKRFSQMQWMIGFGFTLITVALTLIQIFGKNPNY